MNLAAAVNVNRPATLDDIRLAADRDDDQLAVAVLKTQDPAEAVEALFDFAMALEELYPEAEWAVTLDDLVARARRDARLADLVAVLGGVA